MELQARVKDHLINWNGVKVQNASKIMWSLAIAMVHLGREQGKNLEHIVNLFDFSDNFLRTLLFWVKEEGPLQLDTLVEFISVSCFCTSFVLGFVLLGPVF